MTDNNGTPHDARSEWFGLVLDDIILKCANLMFMSLITDGLGPSDYDIISAAMTEEGDWSVFLETPNAQNKIFEFISKANKSQVIVTTYIKAHSFITEF